MFGLQDTLVADHLAAEQQRILRADRETRVPFTLVFGDDTNQVLIDGGFSGDSIIYRHACKLALNAAHITYVSQCPFGKVGRLLGKTPSTLYFNPWDQAKSAQRTC